jgi:transcriptional regulator with XRE-family HTH domain
MERHPDSNDILIGKNLRNRRKMLGFSPQKFADAVGISHQQLNKYENGINRIAVGQLAKMCAVLNVDIGYFIKENILPFDMNLATYRAAQIADQPETKALIKNYIAIGDPRVRDAVVELVTSISKYFSKKAG